MIVTGANSGLGAAVIGVLAGACANVAFALTGLLINQVRDRAVTESSGLHVLGTTAPAVGGGTCIGPDGFMQRNGYPTLVRTSRRS